MNGKVLNFSICLYIFHDFDAQVTKNKKNIYFWLRFGLANAIKGLSKVKNSCCVCREFLTFNWICLTKSESEIIPDIMKRTFKTGFWVQSHLLNLCSSVVNSQRLLCSQKVVWNFHIKALLYTKKNILYPFKTCFLYDKFLVAFMKIIFNY